jgi:hypothetical protein
MSPFIRSNLDKNTRVITQVGKHEYLIEGKSNWARFGCQIDPSIITSAFLDGGPNLLVGDSFLGKGIISHIEHIDSGLEDYIILKVRLYEKNFKN